MPYDCFAEDGNQAAILATNLETGDVIGVCPDHLVDYSVGVLESVTGVKWAPAADQATDPESDEPTDDDEPIPYVPTEAPDAAPADPGEGDRDDDEDQDDGDDHDQLAEDHAVRDAELRAELARPTA